jgi:chemotaxis protein histidine kinase CheA
MDAIQSLLLQLKQTYIAELPDRLDQLETIVLQMEREGPQPNLYNELFRQVHSLKGSGGTHGLPIITSICHPLEDYLSTITPKSDLIKLAFADITFAYLDLLREVVNRLNHKSEVFPDIETVLVQLRQRSFSPRYAALLVENSAVMVKILQQPLQLFNFRVVVQDDGYQALGRALVEPFDLIISAHEIKQLNGLALLTALKLAHGINRHTPTVLLSTNRISAASASDFRPDFLLSKDDQLHTHFSATLARIVNGMEKSG